MFKLKAPSGRNNLCGKNWKLCANSKIYHSVKWQQNYSLPDMMWTIISFAALKTANGLLQTLNC